MSIASQVGKITSDLETRTRAGEFSAICRVLMLAGGAPLEALAIAEKRFTERVVNVSRKTAVNPASLTTASSLAEYTGTTAAFLETLRSVGAFDRMLPDMRQVPPRSRVASTTMDATAYVHGEGAVKPISSLQLDGHTLSETEVAAIVVQSIELIRALSPESGALIAVRAGWRRRLTPDVRACMRPCHS